MTKKYSIVLFLCSVFFATILYAEEVSLASQINCGALSPPTNVREQMLRLNGVPPLVANSLADGNSSLDGSGRPALLSATVTGVNGTTDQTVDVTLSPGFTLSGTINGVPKQFIRTVRAQSTSGTVFIGSINFSTGHYVIVVPAGTYTLTVCFITQLLGGATVAFDDPDAVEVSGNTNRDITVESVTTRTVSGTISGRDPSFDFAFINFQSADGSGGFFQVDSSGSYSAQLPDGTYTAGLSQFNVSGRSSSSVLGSIDVSVSGVTANFTVPPTAGLSGTVMTDMAIRNNSFVFAIEMSGPPPPAACVEPPLNSGLSRIDSAGGYQTNLPSDHTYRVSASLPLGEQAGVVTVMLPDPLEVTMKTTQNITVPALPGRVTFNGRVTDESGNGVANVSVSAFTTQVTGAPNTSFSIGTPPPQTDANGDYSFTVLNGTNYTLTFGPPPPAP